MTTWVDEIEMVELHPDPAGGDQMVHRLPPFMRPRTPSGYVHLPRSASIYTAEHMAWQRYDRLSVRFWCGSFRSMDLIPGRVQADVVRNFTARRPPEMVCGTCDGRAEAYYDTASGTVFRPRDYFADPTWCPFHGIWPDNPHAPDCPLCGHRLRASPYPGYGAARHKPVDLTTDPCPSHGWSQVYAAPAHLQCSAHRCDWIAAYGTRWET